MQSTGKAPEDVVRLWQQVDHGIGQGGSGVWAKNLDQLKGLKWLIAKLFCHEVQLNGKTYVVSNHSFNAFMRRNSGLKDELGLKNLSFAEMKTKLDARDSSVGRTKVAAQDIRSVAKSQIRPQAVVTKEALGKALGSMGLSLNANIRKNILDKYDENKPFKEQIRHLLKEHADSIKHQDYNEIKSFVKWLKEGIEPNPDDIDIDFSEDDSKDISSLKREDTVLLPETTPSDNKNLLKRFPSMTVEEQRKYLRMQRPSSDIHEPSLQKHTEELEQRQEKRLTRTKTLALYFPEPTPATKSTEAGRHTKSINWDELKSYKPDGQSYLNRFLDKRPDNQLALDPTNPKEFKKALEKIGDQKLSERNLKTLVFSCAQGTAHISEDEADCFALLNKHQKIDVLMHVLMKANIEPAPKDYAMPESEVYIDQIEHLMDDLLTLDKHPNQEAEVKAAKDRMEFMTFLKILMKPDKEKRLSQFDSSKLLWAARVLKQETPSVYGYDEKQRGDPSTIFTNFSEKRVSSIESSQGYRIQDRVGGGRLSKEQLNFFIKTYEKPSSKLSKDEIAAFKRLSFDQQLDIVFKLLDNLMVKTTVYGDYEKKKYEGLINIMMQNLFSNTDSESNKTKPLDFLAFLKIGVQGGNNEKFGEYKDSPDKRIAACQILKDALQAILKAPESK